MNAQLRKAVTLAAAAALATIGAGSFSPASAAPDAPVGQCPPGFTLTDASFGPATMALDISQTGNADGWICRKVFTHGPNAGIANIVDNDIPLNVTFH
ncbi:hypothetical protein ACVW00_000521 [Marmoricola sp. URHA0025 HA25]